MGSNLKKIVHLGLNILSAIQGMSAIWNVRYWEVWLCHFKAGTLCPLFLSSRAFTALAFDGC